MRLLPGLEIGKREGVVGIAGEERRVVEHHQPQDHLLYRNRIHGETVLGEMRRWIDMGAILADHLVEGQPEAVLCNGVGLAAFWIHGRRHLGLTETGPDRRVGAEPVGEVNEGLCGDDLEGAVEIIRGAHVAGAGDERGDRQGRDDAWGARIQHG